MRIVLFVFTLFFPLASAFNPPIMPSLRTGHNSKAIPVSSYAPKIQPWSRAGRLWLRAESTPSESADTVEKGPIDSPTVLSDEELEARIAAVGLDRIDPSIKEPENLTPIQQAMKKSTGIGKAAIATAASSAISVLNKIEKVNFLDDILDFLLTLKNCSRSTKKNGKRLHVRTCDFFASQLSNMFLLLSGGSKTRGAE